MQFSLDLATAVSVFIAMWFFLSDQRKERRVRAQEYKLEKASDIIQFLNKQMHKMLLVNIEIDKKLHISSTVAGRNEFIPILTKSDKAQLSTLSRQEEDILKIYRKEFSISSLINKLIELQTEIKNYLSLNPYIQLLKDQKIIDQVNIVIAFNDKLTLTNNQTGQDNRTLLMTIRDIENNRIDLGNFLLNQTKKGLLPSGKSLNKAKEDLNNKTTKPKHHEKILAKACLQDFSEVNKNKKSTHYIQYIDRTLKKVNSNRNHWLQITSEIQKLSLVLSKYSFKSLM